MRISSSSSFMLASLALSVSAAPIGHANGEHGGIQASSSAMDVGLSESPSYAVRALDADADCDLESALADLAPNVAANLNVEDLMGAINATTQSNDTTGGDLVTAQDVCSLIGGLPILGPLLAPLLDPILAPLVGCAPAAAAVIDSAGTDGAPSDGNGMVAPTAAAGSGLEGLTKEQIDAIEQALQKAALTLQQAEAQAQATPVPAGAVEGSPPSSSAAADALSYPTNPPNSPSEMEADFSPSTTYVTPKSAFARRALAGSSSFSSSSVQASVSAKTVPARVPAKVFSPANFVNDIPMSNGEPMQASATGASASSMSKSV